MAKCVRKTCNSEATMDTPEDLCDAHWTIWFCRGWPVEHKIQELKKAWKKYGKPIDWKEQLDKVSKTK
jgi:hypothetical protein